MCVCLGESAFCKTIIHHIHHPPRPPKKTHSHTTQPQTTQTHAPISPCHRHRPFLPSLSLRLRLGRPKPHLALAAICPQRHKPVGRNGGIGGLAPQRGVSRSGIEGGGVQIGDAAADGGIAARVEGGDAVIVVVCVCLWVWWWVGGYLHLYYTRHMTKTENIIYTNPSRTPPPPSRACTSTPPRASSLAPRQETTLP